MRKIQWYPGHMTKAMRDMEAKLDLCDGVIFVLDARAPIASINKNLQKLFKQKPILYVLNKADLADGTTDAFLKFFEEKGHKIIVVTSWQHTTAEGSRHPSGKKLYEYADVVIDNCGPQGDALLDTEKEERICSVSSITGALIAQTIGTEVVRDFMEKGLEAPILWDESLEGAKEHNEKLLEQYKGRI